MFVLSIYLLCCIWISSVTSVKVIATKEGNLVFKGIQKWAQIEKYYQENSKNFGSFLQARKNQYDGGDITIEPHSTRIYLDNTPYHFIRQNTVDCAFEFKCISTFSCLRPFARMRLFANELEDKLKSGNVALLPDPALKGAKPVILRYGLQIVDQLRKDKHLLVAKAFDKTEFTKNQLNVKNNVIIKYLGIDTASNNAKNQALVKYEYESAQKMTLDGKQMTVFTFSVFGNSQQKRLFTEEALLKECNAKRMYVYTPKMPVMLKSYDGDYDGEQCVPLSKEDKTKAAYDEYYNEYDWMYDDAYEHELYDELSKELKQWKAVTKLRDRLNA